MGAPGGTLDAWFERLLHSAAAVTLAGDFVPFADLARSTLATTAARLDVQLDPDELLPLFTQLPAYPDARPSLERLEAAGAAVCVLTNGGGEQTRALLEAAGLAGSVRLERSWPFPPPEPTRAPDLERAAELALAH